MAYVRVAVLVWADILTMYAMWVLMTYLTDVWKLSSTHAAAIINIWTGVAYIMPIGMAFLVDSFMGNFSMLLLSSLAYSIGLGFLSMSTPPVLSNATGTCSKYLPECIGDTQKALFYTALALIVVGTSGHTVSLNAFLTKQIEDQTEPGETYSEWLEPYKCLGSLAVILVPIIGVFVLPYIKPWSVRFGIPAICTLSATLLFLSGSCLYRHTGPQGSPLTTMVRVSVATASKIFHSLPQDASELYEKRDDGVQLVPHTRSLRCLDKAAIILPIPSLGQQEKNRWRLCRVTEVEETKTVIRMIPIWMTFIVCGVVTSFGNSYFLEQAKNMNPYLGDWKVPLPILLVSQETAKSLFANVYSTFSEAKDKSGSRRYAPRIGTAVSMIFSILCCITAAKVETRRLDVIKSHGLLDKPDDRIPMSMFWLLPQFVLLGALGGIFEESTTRFFNNQAPTSMEGYLGFFTNGILGAGIAGNVLSVSIAGKVRPSWFQDTLNRSRLDKYYWTLAAMSSVNLVLYISVAIWYNHKEPATQDEEEPHEGDETVAL